MGATLRRWWPALKAALGLAIVAYVGTRFWHDLTRQVQRRFPDAAGPAPPLRLGTLVGGLLQAGVGWALMGTGLWALLAAWPVGAVAADAMVWLRCTAALAVAYVAGFLTLPAP